MSALDVQIRIAIAQIECHPAAYLSYVMPLEEPFADDHLSLARLGRFGFAVDQLHQTCLDRYTDWQGIRLESIATFLLSLDPPPDILVFPEYSVPWQCLLRLRTALQGKPTTIFGSCLARG